ncbi:hypothetical protein [Methylobacterium sp. ap11]|uniref:hypothetical protein n=1 Tax=Methylobacterium sp. ap11 TaxID=1761799 RepID=UPI0011604EBE|nr:hypothetical protein [Methylobacterium sp. ap11]
MAHDGSLIPNGIPAMPTVDYHRNALRILFILVKGSRPYTGEPVNGFDRVFRGETKVQALDFWVRYPDYLADELLSLYELTSDRQHLDTADRIFADEEPDLRRVPMLRRYFGAYEPLDMVLSILKSRGLVLPRSRQMERGTDEHDFLVAAKASELIPRVVADLPELGWYDRRVDLVLRVAAGRGGYALKERQHRQKEYHDAATGDLIPTTAERVRKRLETLQKAA